MKGRGILKASGENDGDMANTVIGLMTTHSEDFNFEDMRNRRVSFASHAVVR